MCWPAAWVARDLPEARLLSAEYAAPVTGWEVGAWVGGLEGEEDKWDGPECGRLSQLSTCRSLLLLPCCAAAALRCAAHSLTPSIT